MMKENTLVEVAVNAPLQTSLTYKWGFSEEPRLGLQVQVPLGKRKAQGIIIGLNPDPKDSDNFELKAVESISEEGPELFESYLSWLAWLADYYLHPIGQVMNLAGTPLKKGPRKRKSNKAPVIPDVEKTTPPQLTNEQSAVINGFGDLKGFSAHLIHGVTGSGKTEIYLRAIEKVLSQDKQVLVLVPEIALTPQLIQRFAARFGDNIAVLHSHLTEREKTEQWWSAYDGEKQILIGARSALFCPLKKLGLVVIDEEHEGSYKQDEKLKYNARDAAVMLAKLSDVPILLGSATPSLETWYNAKTGRYHLHSLKSRVQDRAMPRIEVIDLRSEQLERKGKESELPFWLSETLFTKLTERLENKEQVALFLNRRGVAQTTLCTDCGFIHRCPNCEISLTLHGKKHLVCHYCDYSQLLEEHCPDCKEGELKSLGLGTEQLEEDLKTLYPEARLRRADRDEITSREDMEELIHAMENNEVDILVGTQMIAKGLDFPNLNLVGLVLADIGFNLPDFRSVEKSFQLLTQMSGRSGRHHEEGGEVVIQTYNPEYPALPFAMTADYEAFSEQELKMREDLNYPPFYKLAEVRLSGTKLNALDKLSDILFHRAKNLRASNEAYSAITILGPADAPLSRVRGRFRKHLILKAPKQNILGAFCKQLLSDQKWVPNGTKVQVDIDPYHLM